MKNIATTLLLVVLLLVIFCSRIITVSAQEWYLETLLEINTGIEVFDINTATIDPLQFSNPSVQFTYDEFISVDKLLKDEFIRQYRIWEISYYRMADIVTNYNNFVYYTNQTFYYLRQRELGYTGKHTDRAIKNWYSNMRVYYTRVKVLVAKK